MDRKRQGRRKAAPATGDGREATEQEWAVAEELRYVLVDKFQDLAVLPEIHSPRQPEGSVAREPLFVFSSVFDPHVSTGFVTQMLERTAAAGRRMAGVA